MDKVSYGKIAFMSSLINKEINESKRSLDNFNLRLNNILKNKPVQSFKSTNNFEELSDSYVCSPLYQFNLITQIK